MTWFKVDDHLHSHPKTWAASLTAMGLWSVAGSWSSDQLTDGFVPDHMVMALSRGQADLADELVRAGFWERMDGGYQFHEWDVDADGTVRNPTRAEALANRRRMSSGGELGNHRRWHEGKGKTDPRCRYCQDGQKPPPNRPPDRVPDTPPESPPSPPVPVPSRPEPRDGGTPGAQGEGDQSVRTRARVREALRWLSANYGLTDTEAARAWETAEARARDRIKNPVRYLQRMAERGHLADIVGAIQTRHDAPRDEPPDLHLIDGPAATLHARRTAIDACDLCDHNGMTIADPDRPKRCDHGDTAPPTQPPLMFTVPGDDPSTEPEPYEPPIHGQQLRRTP